MARKFFGELGESYAIRMVNSAGFPSDFKRQILNSYEGIRNDVKTLTDVNHPMIKILGMNIYHQSLDLEAPEASANNSDQIIEMAANG